jgi:glutamate racemase
VKLLTLDSGIGGLSVAREIRRVLPGATIDYVADDAGFPYGDWEAAALTGHVVDLVGDLVARHVPDAVVIACNTASTLVLPPLRARFSLPIVGTVPAIKPAARETLSGLISVLATPGTIQRDYTRDLIRTFAADCAVELVGSARLAPLAEAYMRGEPVEDADILAEIAPAFVEKDGVRTDVVVLACTHYPFLADRFARLAPWPVAWIDPAPAIARRAAAVLGAAAHEGPGGAGAWLTSGKPWPAALGPLLAEIGLTDGLARV